MNIFLDIDDVCNSLTVHVLKYLGCDIQDENDYPIEAGYNIVEACNKLHPRKKDWSIQSFWDDIPRKVWANTPVSLEFEKLLGISIHLSDPSSIYFATAPTKDPDCLAGKLEWIHNNAPAYMHRQYFITPRKWLLANENSLLLDDNDYNIDMFRKNGGNAILIPRPWNSMGGGIDIVEHVKKELKKIK